MLGGSLFGRLVLHLGLSLLVILVAAGLLLDRFLQDREVQRLEAELARSAAQAAVQLLAAPGGELQARTQALGRATGIRFTVIEAGGAVLADSTTDAETMENHAARPEVAAALRGRRGAARRDSPILGLGMLYVALPTQPVVRAARPVTEVRELTGQIRRRILLAVLPALLLAGVLGWWTTRSLARRLDHMERFATRLARGEYGHPMRPGGLDELGHLERVLEELRLELRRQVSRLSEDRRVLRSLLDALPDAVLLFGADGTCAAFNQAAARLLRLPSREGEGALSKESVVRDPEVLARLDAAYRDPAPAADGLRVRWQEPPGDLEVTTHPIADPEGGRGVLLVLHDVTRRVHLERVRSDFIANMAHELRTPLTAIRGAAETLLDNPTAPAELAGRFLGTIQRHALRLGNLLADISDLAHLESGVAPVTSAPLDAHAVVREAVALFQAEADKAGLHLTAALPEVPLVLCSDAEKVEAILVNLTQNAVRYTPAGGTVTLEAAAQPDGAVEFCVRDTGIGIPPRDLPRVTERFYRVDPGRSREKGGTGLGLSIVKHLVALLGGRLAIQSEPGRGTAVRVTLPNLASNAAPPAGLLPALEPETPNA